MVVQVVLSPLQIPHVSAAAAPARARVDQCDAIGNGYPTRLGGAAFRRTAPRPLAVQRAVVGDHGVARPALVFGGVAVWQA